MTGLPANVKESLIFVLFNPTLTVSMDCRGDSSATHDESFELTVRWMSDNAFDKLSEDNVQVAMLNAHRAADRNLYWFDFAAENNLAVMMSHESPNCARIELRDMMDRRCEWIEDSETGDVNTYRTSLTFDRFLDNIRFT